MRILHLLDRLVPARAAAHEVVAALARRTDSLLAVGRVARGLEAPCEVRLVEGLAASGVVDVGGALDALAREFRPDVVHLHALVGEIPLAWAAGRGGVVEVADLRAFRPERAIGRGASRRGSGNAAAAAASRPLCADCFETDPFFRELRAAARRRVASLEQAGAVVVGSPEDAAELVAAGVTAPIAIVPAGDAETRAHAYRARYARLAR